MLDELLRFAGIDLSARIAAWKAEAEGKAQHAVAHAKEEARLFAVKAGCFAAAGLMALLAFVVMLLLLYRFLDASQGPWTALAVVAIVLCVAGLGLAWIGSAIGRSRPERQHIVFDVAPPLLRPPRPALAPAGNSMVDTSRTVRKFLAPVISFITRNAPLTGNWALDGVLRQVGDRTQASTVRAIEGASDMVRTGSRPVVLAVLGSVGLVGWMLLRRRR